MLKAGPVTFHELVLLLLLPTLKILVLRLQDFALALAQTIDDLRDGLGAQRPVLIGQRGCDPNCASCGGPEKSVGGRRAQRDHVGRRRALAVSVPARCGQASG